MTKVCARCQIEKPYNEYSMNKKGRPVAYCKPCFVEYKKEYSSESRIKQRAYKKKWEAAHPEEVKAAKRRRYAATRERVRAQQKAARLADPERYAAHSAKGREKRRTEGLEAFYRYGITKEQRAILLAFQDGLCSLCHGPLTISVIDHNHETGRIRGLLCRKCNARLGYHESSQRWYDENREVIESYTSCSPAKQTGLDIVARRHPIKH